MSIPSALGGAGVAALGACLSVSRLLLGFAPFTDVRFWPFLALRERQKAIHSRPSRRAANYPLQPAVTGGNQPKVGNTRHNGNCLHRPFCIDDVFLIELLRIPSL